MKQGLLLLVAWVALMPAPASGDNTLPLPDYAGVRYQARVPDTLDIARRAALAAGCITAQADPALNYSQYFFVMFGRLPAYMFHNGGDGCTMKFVENLPALRAISGHPGDPACENAYIERIQQHPPHGRLLSAAGLYYQLTGVDAYRQLGIDAVEQLRAALAFTDNDAYLPRVQRCPGADVITDPNRNHHALLWWIDGLVRFSRYADHPPALTLAGQLVRSLLRDDCYYYRGHEDGSFADEPIMWPGVTGKQHFHCNTLVRLGCLEYALAAGDQKVLDWVRRGYCFAKEHGEPVTGWFPEALAGDVNAVYNLCEMCCVGDMVQLALRLAAAGDDDCWDDADRWIRNALAEGQLTDIGWLAGYYASPYCRAATAFDAAQRPPGQGFADYLVDKFGAAMVTTDRVAERNLGGFGGWVAMNDWFGGYHVRTADGAGYAIMHCCTGNCCRALHAAYASMLNYNHATETLTINLLLNRASRWADIDSHLPYCGRVDIHPKQDMKLAVRLPGWVALNQATAQVGSARRPLTFKGRYAQLGRVAAGEPVCVSFPMVESSTTVRVSCHEVGYALEAYYHLALKGHTVIDIQPEGGFCPLYQRTTYRNNRTRYRQVERFAPTVELMW